MQPIYQYKGVIIDVYDGDTFTIDLSLGFDIRKKEQLRLARVDTPELRGSERKWGLIVRDHVRSLILGKPVVVQTDKDKKGKYGRYIAEVFFNPDREGIEWVNLSDYLLENEMAEPYLG